jgi:hypothetical protein
MTAGAIATFLMGVTLLGVAGAVFFLVFMRGITFRAITFLPLGFALARPSVFALGAARRADPRETFEDLRRVPAGLFFFVLMLRRDFAATALCVDVHAPD